MKKYITSLIVAIFASVGFSIGATTESASLQWSLVRSWLSKHYAQHLSLLNPPVTEQAISSAHKQLGYELPPELVSVLKVNNGESPKSQGLFGALRFMPLSEQVDTYKGLLKHDPRFVAKRFHPFLVSGGGDFYCIDISSGQVIEWWHEGGNDGVRASSLSQYLSVFMSELNKKQYVVLPDFLGLVDKDDL